MGNIKRPIKYKVVNNEVHILSLDGTVTCEECGSLMVEYKDGTYSEWECKGCGNTITTTRTNQNL